MIKHQLEAVGFALSDEDKAEIAKLDGRHVRRHRQSRHGG